MKTVFIASLIVYIIISIIAAISTWEEYYNNFKHTRAAKTLDTIWGFLCVGLVIFSVWAIFLFK